MKFFRCSLSVAFVATIFSAGCDAKKVTDAVSSGVDSAKNTVNQAVETAKQEANLAGSMEVTTSPPINAKACYAKLIITGGERPNVLQLASYKDADQERFPSMFLTAPVSVNNLAELAGTTLQAELFAQPAADGVVWRTRTGSPAAITIGSVEGNALTCQCSGVTLINDATGEEASVTGKFVALVN